MKQTVRQKTYSWARKHNVLLILAYISVDI